MEDKDLTQKEQLTITEKVENAIFNEQNTLPYTPLSNLPNLQTVIPLALSGETLAAQYKFKDAVPNVDEYLIEKLKYNSKIALANAFAAEQADALAFAIYQFENGKGFILADMAGIGKGRVNAGVLRYAYVNDFLPVFITEKPNLFSAIYRDIKDIGGLMTNPDNTPFLGNPLILNGYKSGGFEVTYDEKGKKIRLPKPAETAIIDRVTGKEVIVPPSQKDIKDIIASQKLSKKYNYILLTYSQLAGKAGVPKAAYLKNIFDKRDGNVILAMDEVHNAAGATSDVGATIQTLLNSCKGSLFSSATFSKRPDNMYLYSLKTDVLESPLDTRDLIEVIKKGGERLTENLASSLVLSKQMMRREKTYDNCNVEYEYMPESDKDILFSKYDATIKLYREIRDFFDGNRNPAFYEAKQKAVERFAKRNDVELADKREADEELKDWKARNKGKYAVARFTAGEVLRSQFNFIETLLFALKADFVARNVLSQLGNNKLENLTTATKEKFLSNRKPVVAVRNTLEGVYSSLDLEVGDTLDKADFSVYVYSLAFNAIKGTITLKEVVEDGTAEVITDPEFYIEDRDFLDKGQAYREFLARIEAVDLDIPLSPIDYIIDAIENTERPLWDTKYNQSKTYKVGEVTGRKFRLVKNEDGKYELTLNKKDKNKASAFKKFNDGVYDVLLINESGSTGEDAHSSPQFKDTRPRVMIIHQVELDVNTEVQKRGRVNRTGMLNYPTYIYCVSRIPSEIRRLLMLARKMRSLDANTTGNQKQSGKLSQIRDKNFNPIQDIVNKYGSEVLQEFLSTPDGETYKGYMPSEDQEKMAEAFKNELVIEIFLRNLELAYSQEQENFYDTINTLYLEFVNKLKESGEYDLETSFKNLKASIKNRAIILEGKNTSPFNDSVYGEDNYILAEDKPYSKDKVDELIQSMALGKKPDEFYNEFIEDFKKHYVEVQIPETKESVKKPDYKLARDEEERRLMKAEYESHVRLKLDKLEEEHEAVLNVLTSLKPNKPCLIPANEEECFEVDDMGLPKAPKGKNRGRFIGVKLVSAAKDKYSPMNIELVFCQLSGKAKLTLKPTKKGRAVLDWVLVWSSSLTIVDIQAINTWFVDPNRREMMRVYTGNILSAYDYATQLTNENDNYSRRIEFLKFTTVDESTIRFGIRMFFRNRYIELDTARLVVSFYLNSPALIEYLTKKRTANEFYQAVNSEENLQIILYGYQDINGTVALNIFGGTSRAKKTKSGKYYNELFDDADLRQLLRDEDIDFDSRVYYNYTPKESRRSVELKVLQISFVWDGEVGRDIAKEKMQKVFEYVYSKKSVIMPFRVVDSLGVVSDEKDVYVPDGDEIPEEKEEEGVLYKYSLAIPYEAAIQKLNQFAKFDKYEKSDKGYGVVFLKRRATALEATAYSLFPLEPSPKMIITDSLSVLSDYEKNNFISKLKDMVKENKSDIEIGIFVQETLYGKVLSLRNILGYYADDLEFVGKTFRDYSDGKIEDAKLPEKRAKKVEDEEVDMLPLTFDTAQDFVIQIFAKIR